MAIRNTLNRRSLWMSLLLIVLAAAAYLVFGATFDKTPEYKITTITKGDLESTISSSGTLSPVTVVEVGTQVSGTIDRIFVDFNDRVQKGQIIAMLDSVLLRVAVTDARSGVLRAEAQLEEAKFNFDRSAQLFSKGLISEAEYQPIKTALKTATAAMSSAQAALERAQQNLKYAIIRAPIAGTVTARNVEAGQTVAASFATPTLFTIAQDLSQMEIKALVDESDIGQIKDGQSVRFTVQAYPSKTFEGKVKQVRVQPTTASNVVNYTVVISVANTENLLLPGMTATVDFIIERKSDVLLVPNTALRFQPSEREMTEARQRMREKRQQPPPNFAGTPPRRPDGEARQPDQLPPPQDQGERKRLWFLDKNSKLAMIPIQIGITDGANTEVYANPFVTEGLQVISGSSTVAKSTNKSASVSPGHPECRRLFENRE